MPRMKPPASSVMSSTLRAIVSSVRSRPAVPSPFSSRLVTVSMFFMVLSRLSIVDCRLDRAIRRMAPPVPATSPWVVPMSDLIDSVISRTFLIEVLTSSASALVTLSTLAAMWSTRASSLSSTSALLSMSSLMFSAMLVMVPEVSFRTSSRMSLRIGISVPTSAMMSPIAVGSRTFLI